MKSKVIFLIVFTALYMVAVLWVSTYGSTAAVTNGVYLTRETAPLSIRILRHILIWPLIGCIGWIGRWLDLNLATWLWFVITALNGLIWSWLVWHAGYRVTRSDSNDVTAG